MARVPGLITKVLGTIWVIRLKALGHEMRIREKGSGVMFGNQCSLSFQGFLSCVAPAVPPGRDVGNACSPGPPWGGPVRMFHAGGRR